MLFLARFELGEEVIEFVVLLVVLNVGGMLTFTI
jgi:hypothetical protein